MNKKDALAQIVSLAEAHSIGADEIAAALSHAPTTPAKKSNILGRLFGYIGGVLVFSGIGLLISFVWDDIGSAQRVIVTFGAGLAAFILGAACIKTGKGDKASTPLFLVSGLMQPTGLFVFLDEYMPQSGDVMLAALLIFGALAAQQGAAFYALRRTSLLFLTLFFWNGAIGTGMDWLQWDGELIGLILGVSMICLSWATGKTAHRAITPFWYFFGGGLLLLAWWSLAEGSILELSYPGLNAFLIYFSIIAASRALLFVSVLALLSYMSYFAWEYFAGVVMWPILLIILGLITIGVSSYAVKLGQKIGRDSH
ncbi:MAG: DUF2157 domain-containing protein [Proteobacteria bacterium]|nr:DUF2157 domain-containing protein [Pseudomonadota bacterium]